MTGLLTLVRHGRTAHNAAGRFQGWTDVALDEQGHAQAQALAGRLAAHVVRPTHLYASDLSRTRQTAAPLGEQLGLPVQTSPALREINIGTWEGRTLSELDALDPARFRAWPRVAAPQGESLEAVTGRARTFLDRLALTDTDHAVVVTHGVVITALLCDLLGWNFEEAWSTRRGLHDNTALTSLRRTGGQVSVEVLACGAHLSALTVAVS
ncbi:histidine phosphatase family protein [Deinococcus sp. HMF7604]|uniref:histidine phosphatase family protein n=1 Tax=Deinococcus betulae TaxID=2873312 RepID=UPI001CC90F6D|nr:histidine phosphatase family protein [Deinococcus betulae]MBZ9752100.1 histidine phosphatase family protein [Deinococcus betulae]